ncbi:MAG: Rieske (2Fe-2S) protein [Anaerolineae bacterium]|nr:Rieske (2Fe-2S) protein [Anaerolineae bacterium]
MADIETKPPVTTGKEERPAPAKARAAERGHGGDTAGVSPDGEEGGVSEAAKRFQALKQSQTLKKSRKEREAELMRRAVDVAPRVSAQALPEAQPQKAPSLPINRREFLTYAWGGALSLVLVQGGLATLWFAYPRFKAGEFGGVFTLTTVPERGAKPEENLQGKFWWTNAEEGGMVALYKVCTHLGCLYEWKDQTRRFECPCHGSKFNQSGRNIHGPATRDLDQFVVTVLDSAGNQVDQTTPDHRYVIAEAGLTYKIDTGRKLLGRPSDPNLAVEA